MIHKLSWRQRLAFAWLAARGFPPIRGGIGFDIAQFPDAVKLVLGLGPGQSFLTSVTHDGTLSGAGTGASPLSVVGGSFGPAANGAPQFRFNGRGIFSGNTGSHVPVIGTDAQGTDTFLVSVTQSTNASPTFSGASKIFGPTQVSGASTWATLFIQSGANIGNTVTGAAGGNIFNIETYAMIPGTRGSISVDQSTQDTSPTVAIGYLQDIAAQQTPSQTFPQVIFKYLLMNTNGGPYPPILSPDCFPQEFVPASNSSPQPLFYFAPYGPSTATSAANGFGQVFCGYTSNTTNPLPRYFYPWGIDTTASTGGFIWTVGLY
jgi:hypothetical protein